MKLAVPTTQENQVDAHFGHCEFFTVFAIEDGEIKNSQIVESSQGCGCKSNIASVLREMGVKVMLVGNMGGGAVNILNHHGIDVFRGCDGGADALIQEFVKEELIDVFRGCDGGADALIQEFVKEELVDSGESCHQHEGRHHDDGH